MNTTWFLPTLFFIIYFDNMQESLLRIKAVERNNKKAEEAKFRKLKKMTTIFKPC
jgi:hypothetical protein